VWLQLRRDAYGTGAEVAVFLAFLVAFTAVSFGSNVSQEQEFNQALLEQFSMPRFQNTESIDSWLLRSLSLLFPRDAIAPGFFHDDKLELIGHMQQRQLSMPAVECAAVGVYSAAAQWCYKSFSAEYQNKATLHLNLSRTKQVVCVCVCMCVCVIVCVCVCMCVNVCLCDICIITYSPKHQWPHQPQQNLSSSPRCGKT
jgi:hypothetical protein